MTERNVDYWARRWTENETDFHKSSPNFALLNHGHLLLIAPQLRVLLPLCGKSLDLKWFYDAGHSVVGIEAVEKPVKEFFEEHNIPHVIEEISQGKLFKSNDDRLLIYCMDIFKLDATILGKFDVVFDRGSLVAIDDKNAERYIKLVKSVLAPDFRYLVNVCQYEINDHFSGPPRNVSTQSVEEDFGDMCHVKEVEIFDRSQEDKVRNKYKLDALKEVVLLLTPK